jgi:osmotically-inducible protein OsmY
LASRAEGALLENPTLDIVNLDVLSMEGRVTLRGRTHSQAVKQRAVETVRRTLESAGLRFETIIDEIQLQ